MRPGARELLSYVDLEGNVTKMLESVVAMYVVPSPDGRHIVFPEVTVSNSNAWLFQGL